MSDEDNSNSATEPEVTRKLFLGGLDYGTTEDGLRDHFSKYGSLVDVVVMRFPDTKRSRGFGFITYSTTAEADAAFAERPHVIDGANIETKRATPREEMGKSGSSGGGGGGSTNSETHRKLFIGGLNYATTDEGLREYFSKFGELVDCVVMKFRDTKRSRGFGFVTYADVEMVDACQASRPHTIDGAKVETKRATPRDESSSGSGQTVAKVFIGGLKDVVSDDDLKNYFENFGTVIHVEQMTDKSTGRKRGFGFIEFDDYDPVDKLMLQGNHHIINGTKIDVKKAISKSEMNNMGGGGGGGGRGPPRSSNYDRSGPKQAPAPWGSDDGGWGGGQRGGGYGGGNFGNGGNGHGGGNSWGNSVDPWSSGGGGGHGGFGGPANSWDDGGSSGWGSGSNAGASGGWGDAYGGGYGYGSQGGFGSRGGGSGGPIRSQGQQGFNRSHPYSVGARGGGVGNRGGAGGFSRGGGGAGAGGSRW